MRSVQHYMYIIILVFGFFLGRLSTNSLLKKQTKKEIVHTEEKKQEVSTQATTQKVSTLSQQTAYTEKFYNTKGILTREIVKTSNSGASINQDVTVELKQTSDLTDASIEKVTITKTYQSNLKVGLILPTSDILHFQNSLNNFQDINAIASYRLIGNFELIGMTNYKFSTQVGFMIGF